MSELEELKRQKKEIEHRIKELLNPVTFTGKAKIDLHRYSRGDEWFIAIKERRQEGKQRWVSIIMDYDKQKCIDQIDEVIADLTELKERLHE